MALPKPPVGLPSSCHWIKNAVQSAVLTTASQAAILSNGFGKEHLCAQSPGNMDRKWTERSKQLLFPSSPCQGGENKQSLFFSQLLLILGRRQGKECQPQSILTSSILHFLHSTWPGILPLLSSPGPTSVLLNSTPNRLVSKCIPRDAPRIQGHTLLSHQSTPG